MKKLTIFLVCFFIIFWAIAQRQKPNRNQLIYTAQSKTYNTFRDYLISATNLDSLQKIGQTNHPNSSQLQNKKYASFRDYPLVENLDSLELVVRAKKNNPEQYLHGLITLEINRIDYAGYFGQDLKTIKTLAYQLRFPLAIAMYQYLDGYHSREQNFGMAARSTLQAIQYFETTKDTSGMIAGYYSILFFNVLGNPYQINNSKNSTIYYNRIMSLGQKSSALRDKVKKLSARTNFAEMIPGKKYDTKTVLALIEETKQIINQNPNIAPLDTYLYANISRLYSIIGFNEDQQLYLQKSHEYDLKIIEANKKRTSKINIDDCLNTAISYNNIGFSGEAEKYLLKGIKATEQLREEDRNNGVYSTLYAILSEIQFDRKEYAAARASREKSVELISIVNIKLKTSFFEQLNTQYILNQKQIENFQLKQSNQLSELRNQQFRTILFLSLIALSIVLILLYLLLKTNKNQKQLILFRDQLFAIISHDLRNPMSTLQRYSDIIAYLVKTKQFDRLDTTTKQIDQIGKNLANLLNNLLAWSLNQQGLIKNSPEVINLKVFFQELLPIYHDMANLSSLAIVENIEDIKINLDSHKFALIIRNMLDNAIKFSEENNKITISATRQGNEFLMSMSNKSRPSTLQQKIAIRELFNSDKDYLIGENKDLGIGSILVKQYAKIMGAKITFDYDIDCLTIFTFSLPHTTNA